MIAALGISTDLNSGSSRRDRGRRQSAADQCASVRGYFEEARSRFRFNGTVGAAGDRGEGRLAIAATNMSGGDGSNCVEIAALSGGRRAVRDSEGRSGPVLGFASEEWDPFVDGVKSGEFD
ncbi:DUF397 domain-containing protein [Streptosporangium sp. G11]|uniref:DUF397 domain-containing protein n=1 Tax=Streptosporangium sp. G11 TaxID=3436926 RepID=UPI003EBB642C